MKTDKDKPRTWLKYKTGMCNDCFANCCMMPVEVSAEDLLKLGLATSDELQFSIKKTARKLIKQGVLQSYREGTDLFMLSSRPNGDCYFLDNKTRLCTVYEQRPSVCRSFPAIGPRPDYCPYSKRTGK